MVTYDLTGTRKRTLVEEAADQHATFSKSTLKYKKYDDGSDPASSVKKTPSQVVLELTQPRTLERGWRPKPKIVEFLNISEYTSQVKSAVALEEPLFQPFPPQVTFHRYEPQGIYTATLYLRNNDNVGRRIKVLPPASLNFSVARHVNAGDEASKVSAGLEVAYVVTFKPDTAGDYACDLQVVTEREKFIVPVICHGAAPALDFPDELTFASAPVKTEARQTCW